VFLHHPLLVALSCFSGCPRNRGKSKMHTAEKKRSRD
jgi:hypothetical protein